MSLELFFDVFRNSILITGLVLIMMLMIEYFNIQSHGEWLSKIKNSKIKQIILGGILGLIPGCIGGFATVSLYTHRILSFGALVAMMIASSGDEAFVILAMVPEKALLLFGLLFGIAIITGILVDYVIYRKPQKDLCSKDFEYHPLEDDGYVVHNGHKHSNNNIPSIFKRDSYRVMLHPSKERMIILLGIALFISAVIFGILGCGHEHGANGECLTAGGCGSECVESCSHNNCSDSTCTHSHTINILNERWINIVFAIISIITLFFTATAKEHFIKEHLWKHVIKKHLVSIFLWTFGALLICHIGMQYLDIEGWVNNNIIIVILIAIVIGIIPESGPHMVFITLFAQGIIPFYVLLINSIVQDGHTTLPLLAESKMSFVKAKLINICVGIIVGVICYIFNS